MHNLCSIADNKFARHILALNSSLHRFDNDYCLHLLCLDDDIFYLINHPNITKYRLADFIEVDHNLYNAQSNSPSREALVNGRGEFELAKKIQFIWSLSSYFTNFCLLNTNSDGILYVDSDIYFFDDYKKIFNLVKDNNINIGLVEHRIPFKHDNGKYNVGIVYFAKNISGIRCSTLWKDCLLIENHQYKSRFGDCGDQKYLELFPVLFDGVQSFDEYFGHLAPWNLQFHTYLDDSIIWMNKQQNLMYYHFSNFKPDFEENCYIPAQRHGITNVSTVPLLKKTHDEYYTQLKYAL